MPKKYELTGEWKMVKGVQVYRIKALRDIGNVKTGEEGGFIESEDNLSQFGHAWVGRTAIVMDCAYIRGNAIVERTIIKDSVLVQGNTVLIGPKILGGNKIYGDF